jgi:hypothetical protein
VPRESRTEIRSQRSLWTGQDDTEDTEDAEDTENAEDQRGPGNHSDRAVSSW